MDKSFTSYHIEERSFIAYIKREIHTNVTQARFNQHQVGEIDIVVSELSSNLVKHAGGGELLFRCFNSGEKDSTFEIVSIDSGPGIPDMMRMSRDGVSTVGTLGNGLGAITRLSTFSQVYSIPKWGTIVYSRVSTNKDSFIEHSTLSMDIRSLCVNKPRELVCGDGYAIKKNKDDLQVFFGDGLGHGVHAEEAVKAAERCFMESKEVEPVEILRQIHEAVRKTRGLVALVATFNEKNNEWKICGIGNVLARMYSGIQYKNYMSYNGTVGMTIPNSMKDSIQQGEKNQHFVVCSDGIRTRWEINRYPSVFKYDGKILAACIYKDYTRRTDDSSVLIAKVN
jgi:anti-sigma regulatory factor (Ser/Thr protein kinase)